MMYQYLVQVMYLHISHTLQRVAQVNGLTSTASSVEAAEDVVMGEKDSPAGGDVVVMMPGETGTGAGRGNERWVIHREVGMNRWGGRREGCMRREREEKAKHCNVSQHDSESVEVSCDIPAPLSLSHPPLPPFPYSEAKAKVPCVVGIARLPDIDAEYYDRVMVRWVGDIGYE
jgi:hypothetical protein